MNNKYNDILNYISDYSLSLRESGYNFYYDQAPWVKPYCGVLLECLESSLSCVENIKKDNFSNGYKDLKNLLKSASFLLIMNNDYDNLESYINKMDLYKNEISVEDLLIKAGLEYYKNDLKTIEENEDFYSNLANYNRIKWPQFFDKMTKILVELLVKFYLLLIDILDKTGIKLLYYSKTFTKENLLKKQEIL